MANIPPHLLPPQYLNANQHRLNPPTQYENLLGDAIESAFRTGIETLPELVAWLNDQFVPSPGRPGPKRCSPLRCAGWARRGLRWLISSHRIVS